MPSYLRNNLETEITGAEGGTVGLVLGSSALRLVSVARFCDFTKDESAKRETFLFCNKWNVNLLSKVNLLLDIMYLGTLGKISTRKGVRKAERVDHKRIHHAFYYYLLLNLYELALIPAQVSPTINVWECTSMMAILKSEAMQINLFYS